MGGLLQERSGSVLDLCEHVIWPVQHLVVVEAQHFEALIDEEPISLQVVLAPVLGFVAVTIDFDDEACREPGEIGDVRSDRCFSAKACAVGPQVAEHVPHCGFGLG
jgi:hypothetical protein